MDALVPSMIACLDTHYSSNKSRTAVVLFAQWSDASSIQEYVVERVVVPAEYIPGQFYKRELPCILEAIEHCQEEVETLVVDGYVQLGNERPGLGQKLYEALDETVPVIGVAKNGFQGADEALPIYRGGSTRPLFITAIGCNLEDVAQDIKNMHGNFRIPTLLKRVDQQSRGMA